MPHTYVYIHLQGAPVPAGRLDFHEDGRDSSASFRYLKAYLAHPDRVALDPVMLPLPEPDQVFPFRTPEGFALFNGLRDAAPDGWGRYVMDTAATNRPLSEFDYLVATGDERVGALAFGPDASGPKRTTPWRDERPLKHETLDLAAMAETIRQLNRDEAPDPRQLRLLTYGSSLGGARPKANTRRNGELWIAKVSREDDRLPVCQMEYAAMRMAGRLGLDVPPIALEQVNGQHVYFIRRFDREQATGYERRLPFISGLTLLGAYESEGHLSSYRQLAEALRVHGSKPSEDIALLWRRMVFNILCGNSDDHLRNHGFLWDGQGWRLSPLYDVMPIPQVSRERTLALGVGRHGRQATLANALSETLSFGWDAADAKGMLKFMQQQVRTGWRQELQAAGVEESRLPLFENCFAACDEPLPD